MDRLPEFTEIIQKFEVSEGPILRNRKSKQQQLEEERNELLDDETKNSIYNFSKSFLNECTLTNSTLIQISRKSREISQKSDQFQFSFSTGKTGKGDVTKEIDEALNICSMNISVLKKKLDDFKNKTVSNKPDSFFSKLFQSKIISLGDDPILEHCRLVVLFLEGRVGRITEDFEAYKTRKKNREKLLYTPGIDKKRVASVYNSSAITKSSTNDNDETMSMLQVENTRMIEEMSRGLFETLSSTETQILQISRLQSTLQSHLSMQHDLTCRLFEDSISTVQDTRKGNEYLKKSGKDSSTMRKFLVFLILLMSLLLLLLHYFNK